MLLWQLVLSFATIVLMGGYSPLLLAQEEGKQGETTPSLTSEEKSSGAIDTPYSELSVPELLNLIRQQIEAEPQAPAGTLPSGILPADLSPLAPETVEVEATDKLKRYRLGPNDLILITVDRFPDFNFQGTVNPEGAIVLPLVGTLRLEGLTLEEAQEKIRQDLDRYIIDPRVSLSLLAQRPVQITIVGEITRPGFYPLGVPRLSDALLAAGGSLATADLRQVQIRRTLPDGTVLQQRLDLYTPLQDGLPLPNLRLEDGDVLYVPRLQVLNDPTYNNRLVAISTLAKPTISIRVLSHAANGVGTLNLPSGSHFRDALNGIPLNTANINSIALIRYDPVTQKALKTDLNGRRVILGDPKANIPLQDNDVVVIGRNFVTQISVLLNRFTQPFRDVLGFLLFFDSIQENASNLFQSTGGGRN